MNTIINTRFLGAIEVSFEGVVKINGVTATPEVGLYAVQYGLKQSIDDAGASPDKGKAGSQERLKSLMEGHVPAGGGARLSPEERHTRDVVVDYLTKAGFKKTDARKAATENVEAAFGQMLELAYKTKTGHAPDEKKAAELLAANWPKVEREVEKRLSAEKLDVSVEV